MLNVESVGSICRTYRSTKCYLAQMNNPVGEHLMSIWLYRHGHNWSSLVSKAPLPVGEGERIDRDAGGPSPIRFASSPGRSLAAAWRLGCSITCSHSAAPSPIGQCGCRHLMWWRLIPNLIARYKLAENLYPRTRDQDQCSKSSLDGRARGLLIICGNRFRQPPC